MPVEYRCESKVQLGKDGQSHGSSTYTCMFVKTLDCLLACYQALKLTLVLQTVHTKSFWSLCLTTYHMMHACSVQHGMFASCRLAASFSQPKQVRHIRRGTSWATLPLAAAPASPSSRKTGLLWTKTSLPTGGQCCTLQCKSFLYEQVTKNTE